LRKRIGIYDSGQLFYLADDRLRSADLIFRCECFSSLVLYSFV
jgi:hypothetical protein